MSQELSLNFQNGMGSGLAAVVVCAVISLVAIDFVWLRIMWVAVSARLSRSSERVTMREQVFFRTQLGAYIASLLFSNFLSGIGYMVNITWISKSGMTQGSLCSVQGTLTQIGDTAAAYFTAAIAVHTFCTLALRNRLPGWFCGLAVGLGWAATLASGIVPAILSPASGPIFGIDGSSCGISLRYPLLQTVLHLVPIFIASLVSAVFYSLVFLILRGTLIIKDGFKVNLDPEARWQSRSGSFDYLKFVSQIAKSMLWLPIAYVILMLSHIIVCLLETSGFSAPFTFKVFAVACSALLGVANVLIFYNTLRIMSRTHNGSRPSQNADVESFVSPGKSPVDDAPPVSAVVSQRPFPPPRTQGGSEKSQVAGLARAPSAHLASRQTSMVSLSGESARRLLPPNPNGHGRSGSSISAVTASSLQRSITPISELNEMITTAAEPMYIRNLPPLDMHRDSRADSPDSACSDDSLNSLPAPRRKTRSPILRRPTVPPPVSVPAPAAPVDNAHLTAVSLHTAGSTPTNHYSRSARESFINMYASRTPDARLTFGNEESIPDISISSPQPSPMPQRRVRPAVSAVNIAARYANAQSFASIRDEQGITSPFSGSSSDFSTSPGILSGDSDVPLSPFMGELIKRTSAALTSPLPRSEGHERTHSESTRTGGMSNLAWATLVTNAARSEMTGRSPSQRKSSRRKSRSLDNLRSIPVPPVLRPGTPASATVRQEFLASPTSATRSPTLRRNMTVNTPVLRSARPYSRTTATLHEGPSRTPTLQANPGTPQPYGYF